MSMENFSLCIGGIDIEVHLRALSKRECCAHEISDHHQKAKTKGGRNNGPDDTVRILWLVSPHPLHPVIAVMFTQSRRFAEIRPLRETENRAAQSWRLCTPISLLPADAFFCDT